MRYLNNAFSLAMLGELQHVQLQIERVTLDEARALARPAHSVVGHEATRRLYEALLGFEVDCNRETIWLVPQDELIVGQYLGPRLPEGATALPEGAQIVWWLVSVR